MWLTTGLPERHTQGRPSGLGNAEICDAGAIRTGTDNQPYADSHRRLTSAAATVEQWVVSLVGPDEGPAPPGLMEGSHSGLVQAP